MLALQSALVLDFDGTVANTFEPSPSGLGVEGAYEYAVSHLFGTLALEGYKRDGGLQNRSPGEVVEALRRAGFGKDYDTASITDELVRLKIDCLIGGIGQPLHDGVLWPRLTRGFADFWRCMSADATVFTVILSSGHRAFITKTFEVNGLPLPNLMVTDDELRALPQPLHKPNPQLWHYMLETANATFGSAVYVGDDQVKDGELARNVGVPFFHFTGTKAPLHRQVGTFDDWRDLLRQLSRD